MPNATKRVTQTHAKKKDYFDINLIIYETIKETIYL